MMSVTRRHGLGLGLGLSLGLGMGLGIARPAAARTVAAAPLPRKRPAGTHPVDDDLDDLSEMKLADPPKPLPELTFTAADGSAHHIADFRGRGMVLNLWATWCRPCIAEMPSLSRLSVALAPDDIAVLAVSTDHGGAPVVRKFFDDHGIASLPVLLDSGGEIGQALNIRGIPTTLVIDRAGRERGRLEGAANWDSDEAVRLVRRLASSG